MPDDMRVQRSVPIRLQVARQIRAAISDMRFAPGQILVERELCEATGASRASVREALRELESEPDKSLPGGDDGERREEGRVG